MDPTDDHWWVEAVGSRFRPVTSLRNDEEPFLQVILVHEPSPGSSQVQKPRGKSGMASPGGLCPPGH